MEWQLCFSRCARAEGASQPAAMGYLASILMETRMIGRGIGIGTGVEMRMGMTARIEIGTETMEALMLLEGGFTVLSQLLLLFLFLSSKMILEMPPMLPLYPDHLLTNQMALVMISNTDISSMGNTGARANKNAFARN